MQGEYSELEGKGEEVIYPPNPQVSPTNALSINLKIYLLVIKVNKIHGK